MAVQLVFQEHQHIEQGNVVFVQPLHEFTVLVVFNGVGGIEQLRHLVIHAHQLGKLSGVQAVRQSVAVHGLNVRQTHGAFDLRAGVQLVEDFGLRVIIAAGNHQRHHVACAEGVLNFEVGRLTLVHVRGLNIVVAVYKGTAAGQNERANQEDYKQRRYNTPGFHGKLADGRDVGQELFVAGTIHQRAEQHQKSRHQGEYGEQTEQNGLHQNQRHVQTDFELHEAQRGQTGHRGQGRGADLRDGLAQGGDAGVPGGAGLPLVGEAVAQDDGIVNGQRQLQHHGHGVGDEADGAQLEVGAHVQNGRHAEGDHQHRNLGVGAGGQGQHDDDDDHGYDQDDGHFPLQGGVFVVANVGVYAVVVAVHQRFHIR